MRSLNIEIVPVGCKKAGCIAELGAKTFKETFADSNDPGNLQKYIAENFTEQIVAREINNPGSFFFLALYGEKTAGYLKINIGDAQNENLEKPGLEIERIYVLKEFKGLGIGKILMNTAFQFATDHGLYFVWLGVWEHNQAAQRFYEKLGFKVIGSHDFILGDDRQTDILMGIDLLSNGP